MQTLLLILRIFLTIASGGAGIFFLMRDEPINFNGVEVHTDNFAGVVLLVISIALFISVIITLSDRRKPKTKLY